MARTMEITCFMVLLPRYWRGGVTDAKVARVTKNRPLNASGPVVELKLVVPAAIFAPYMVPAAVEIDEGRVVPIEVTQQYEVESAEPSE